MNSKNEIRFIVFEGIDGAGKTTQIKLLADRLAKEGKKVYVTAEPTASVTGGLLRDALSGLSKRSEWEMATLFTLDRISHNVNPVNGIEKMLSDGMYVISDRYYYSSLAYQGAETDLEWVRAMNLNCPEIRKPDICIFLDLTPEQSLERIGRDRTTTEIYEGKEKLQKTRDSFYRVFDLLGDSENVRIVDASRDREEVAEKIYDLIF